MAQFAANFVAHTRMQNVLSTVKITIKTRLRQSNFLIQLVFWNLTSCSVEGARTFQSHYTIAVLLTIVGIVVYSEVRESGPFL